MRSNNQAGEDHLLQGQTGDWILRLSNIGTAPATNVTLKTNLPWISIPANDNPTLDKENTTESKSILLENNAKSCCVGPTGTLMKLPIHGSQLQRQGSIQPGETVDVAIRIKASACGGTHDFYMLYRYELDTSSSTSGSSRPHRWLKRLRQVPVYPSLSLSASVLPFTFHKSEYVLTVEVSNHRNDRPSGVTINLEKLNLFSRQYRLERMPGQFLSGDGSSRVAVDWRERVTLHYRLVPLERKTNACLLSECPFTEGAITSVEGSLSFRVKSNEYFIPIEGAIDVEAEKIKIQEELKYTEGFLKSVQKKLSNERFVSSAPESVVAVEKAKQADAEAKIAMLKTSLAGLE